MFTVKSLHKNIKCRVPWTISIPNYMPVELVFADKAVLKFDNIHSTILGFTISI